MHYLRVKTAPTRPLSRAEGAPHPVGKAVVGSKKAITSSKMKRVSRAREEFLNNAVADDESRENLSRMLQRDDEDLVQIFSEAGLVGHATSGDWAYLMDEPDLGKYESDVDDDDHSEGHAGRHRTSSLSVLMRAFEHATDDVEDALDSDQAWDTLDSDVPGSDQDYDFERSPQPSSPAGFTLAEFERRIERIRAQWQNQTSGADRDTTSMERIEKQINALENDFDRAMQYSLRQRSNSAGTQTETASGEDRANHSGNQVEEDSGEHHQSADAAQSDNARPVPSTSRISRQIPATLSGVHVLWSITDFSPSWDDISGGAKVIITGEPRVEFDADMRCVFGTVAVHAERLAPNVLRCEAPTHPAGVVSMYLVLANGNGHPVSEISSFEYIESSTARTAKQPAAANMNMASEMDDRSFQMRLVQLLTTLGSDSSGSPTHSGAKSDGQVESQGVASACENVTRSTMHMNALSAIRAAKNMDLDPYNLENVTNEELTKLLTGMLQARLKSVIVHENRRMKARLALPSVANAVTEVEKVAKSGGVQDDVVEQTQVAHDALLNVALAPSAYARKDKSGLTIFHCCAALGIEWAVRAMCATGVDLNHTDAFKRTALHWAVARGHEMVVATLLSSGAKSRTVAEWEGNLYTPAELAIHCGHEGIAAYISEANLASALDQMNLRTSGSAKANAHRREATGKVNAASIKRTTFNSDSDGSDSEEACGALRKVVQTTRPRHRRKASKAWVEGLEDASNAIDPPDDSETEAALIVKRAERARESLVTTLRELKVKPEYVNAQLHAQIGKRRTRQLKKDDIPNLLSELMRPAGEDASGSLSRRPTVRARRIRQAESSPKASVPNSIQNGDGFSDGEDEEAIQRNVVRIKSTLQSAHARSQYLRLRRATNQLRRELQIPADYSSSEGDDVAPTRQNYAGVHAE